MKAVAYFTSERISMERLDEMDSVRVLKKEGSFRLFAVGEKEFVYAKDYGSVVFIGMLEEKIEHWIRSMVKIAELQWTEYQEMLVVKETGDTQSTDVDFDVISVDVLTKDLAHIIGFNLAQSVALHYYQNISQKLLEETKQYTTQLEKKGRLSLGRKKLLKYLGASLNIKNRISENLYIFETPSFSWEREEINRLDRELNDELEIKLRYEGIKDQLEVVEDNLNLFKDLDMHNHSSRLEWIIILLILFEVVHVLIEKII